MAKKPRPAVPKPARAPRELSALLDFHLKQLKIDAKELAKNGGLTQNKVQSYLYRQDRYITRAESARLAFALATMYESRWQTFKKEWKDYEKKHDGGDPVDPAHPLPPRYQGVEDLEHILGELLDAAGFRAATPGRDLIWHRLAGQKDRTLRIGWFEFPPFCMAKDGAGQARDGEKEASPTGIAAHATEMLCDFLGVEPEWKKVSLGEATIALWTGMIDVLACEYVKIDPHVFDLWTSAPIPALRVRPAILASRAALEVLPSAGGGKGDGAKWKVILQHTDTRVGKSLSRLAVPRHFGAAHPGYEVTTEPRQGGLRDICNGLQEVDRANRVVHAFATDSVTAAQAMSRQDLGLWRPVHAAELPRFEVCFALHPQEGDRLGSAINGAIRKMREMGFYSRLIESNGDWKETLQRADALPTEKVTKEMEFLSAMILKYRKEFDDPNG